MLRIIEKFYKNFNQKTNVAYFTMSNTIARLKKVQRKLKELTTELLDLQIEIKEVIKESEEN